MVFLAVFLNDFNGGYIKKDKAKRKMINDN